MIALVDVHISNRGQTSLSHRDFALKFLRPTFQFDVSHATPKGLLARSLVALLTNPCFKCPKTIDTILFIPISQELSNCFCYLVSCHMRNVLQHIIFPKYEYFLQMANKTLISLLHKAIKDCIFFKGLSGRYI